MTHCTRCNVDVQPYGDMQTDGRVVDCCPKCNGAIGSAPAVTTQAVEQPRLVPARVVVSAPQDPVTVIRSRLAAVDAQIPTPEQMRALRREQRQLRAALRALGADPAPKPN